MEFLYLLSAYQLIKKDSALPELRRPAFHKLGFAEPHGSAKACQGLRETKMRHGETVSMAVLNFYVRIKIRVAIFDINHFVSPHSCNWNLL
jgi:hypothetical protein